MHAHRQVFRNQLPTPRTAFAGVTWINLHDPTASFFRFAGQNMCKLVPRCVSNMFRKTMVMQHPAYIQIFKADCPETSNKFTRFLVREIATAIGNPFVEM